MNRYKVLVVDNEMLSRDLLTNHLRHTGFIAITAGGVTEAVKLIAEHKDFPLALVSLGLGEKAAIRLTGLVKESTRVAVAILVGAQAGALDSEILGRTGAWDLIVKPFRLEEVKLRLAQAMEVFELRVKVNLLNARIREMQKKKRLPRALEQEVRIPDVNRLVLEMEMKEGEGEKGVAAAVKDIPGSLVESSYRRQQRGASTEADAIEQIRRLSELQKTGILTEKEFNEKKKELLSRI